MNIWPTGTEQTWPCWLWRDGELPPVEAADKVARKCGVAPDQVYLLIAPTASLVGSVQVAARVVETGLHKMHEVGYDIDTVISGIGTCPLASIAKKDLHAIGRTNDAVLYGGRAWYTVRAEDAQIEEVIEQLPSSSSRDYGTLFYDLFKRYDEDFYKIDPLLFSPAEVYINNVSQRAYLPGGRRQSRADRGVTSRVMNVGILGKRGGWHTTALQAACARRGITASVLPITRLTARLAQGPILAAGERGAGSL